MNENILGEYKLVLGLEIHLQLNTQYKMFCGCQGNFWGLEPNTNTCPVCLGLPGALPVPNKEAVKNTQLMGLALHCDLNKDSRFDRKHYFYPDLPKGYQISQYKQPLCIEGFLELESGNKAVIERVHLEEDVAKSFHEKNKTLIDYNKSGVPLVEIVTKPCFTNVEDAVDYAKQIQNIARRLGISDVDMEKGQMRLEANTSLRTEKMEQQAQLPDYKVEVKNINSFKFMEKAIVAEIKRQRKLLEEGGTPIQENRGYDEVHNKTVPQRSKEEASDYRYFPEPDIPPLTFDDKYIQDLKNSLPELPYETIERLVKEYEITEDSAKLIVENLGYEYVYKIEKIVEEGIEPQDAANELINNTQMRDLDPEEFAKKYKESRETLEDENILAKTAEEVISESDEAVKDYLQGKEASIQYLLGQMMKKTKGKADPKRSIQILKQLLSQKK